MTEDFNTFRETQTRLSEEAAMNAVSTTHSSDKLEAEKKKKSTNASTCGWRLPRDARINGEGNQSASTYRIGVQNTR